MLLSEGVTRTPHPEGQYLAVCVDVVDMGMKETKYGLKPKMRLAFETEATQEREDERGRAYEQRFIISAVFTPTLNEKGKLRPFLESWLGRRMTRDELRGFDPELLIGQSALITVAHSPKDGGGVYDNIIGIAKLPRQMEAFASAGTYVRVKDREDAEPDRTAQDQARRMNSTPPRAPLPPAPKPTSSITRDLAKAAAKPAQDFEDFPGALQDEDDDLPF